MNNINESEFTKITAFRLLFGNWHSKHKAFDIAHMKYNFQLLDMFIRTYIHEEVQKAEKKHLTHMVWAVAGIPLY